MGAGFELLGLGGAGLAVLLQTGQQLALADRLQIQIPVVVLAENVRELTACRFGQFLNSILSISDLKGYRNFQQLLLVATD